MRQQKNVVETAGTLVRENITDADSQQAPNLRCQAD